MTTPLLTRRPARNLHQLLAIATLLLFPLLLSAANITSVASGSYTEATTWDLGRVPAAGDDVFIASGTTVSVDTGAYEFVSLQIDASGTLTIIGLVDFSGAGPIQIQADGTLAVQNTLTFGADITNDGTIRWTGGNIVGQTHDIINRATFTSNLQDGNIQSRIVNSATVTFGGGASLNVSNLTEYLGETGSVLSTVDPKGLNVTKTFTLESGATAGPIFALGISDIFRRAITVTLEAGSTFGTGAGALGIGDNVSIGGTADFTPNFEEIAFGAIPFDGATVTGVGQEFIIPAGTRLQTLDGGNVTSFSAVTVNGTLAGNGLITPNVTINSGATLAPGLESDPRLPVIPTNDGYGCAEFANDLTLEGTLVIDVREQGGPGPQECMDFDQVVVDGTIFVGAAVEFNLPADPAPLVGFIYEFVDAVDATGTFDSVDPDLPNSFEIFYDTPDPNSIALRSTKPLPVEFSHFFATADRGGIVLDWGTVTESGNEFFAVERSADGEAFITIGRVSGSGTTYEARAYRFVDTEAAGEELYYRLRQVDFDGAFEYSEVRTVRPLTDASSDLRVFPNPVSTGAAEVRFAPLPSAATLSLHDPLGREISRQELPAASVRGTVDLTALPSGPYHLRVRSDSDLRTVTILRR